MLIIKKSTLFILLFIFCFNFLAACGGENSSLGTDPTNVGNGYGYPGDFPVLDDTGGLGAGTKLTGFGGDVTKDMTGNRAQLGSKRPVIIIHGNSGNAYRDYWGILSTKVKLKSIGYSDAHIWAVSYLGKNNTASVSGEFPHSQNIDDIRTFINTVISYLGVSKVDLIGHSLGCGMIRSYICGLKNNNTFDNSLQGNNNIGTAVLIAGLNRGMGTWVNPVYGLSNYDYQNSSTFIAGCNARENGYSSVTYVCAYSSYDQYEYYYKDEYWNWSTMSPGAAPGMAYYYCYNWFYNSQSAAPAAKNPNYSGGSTSSYTGLLIAATHSKNFTHIELSDCSDLLNGLFSGTYLPLYYHMAMINSQTVFNWYSQYLNQ